MITVALLALLAQTPALALPPEQVAAQDAFVASVAALQPEMDLVRSSYDTEALLFGAELAADADQEAIAAALVTLLDSLQALNSGWVFGQGARQNPELKPLFEGIDEINLVLRYGGTLVPTAGVSPAAQAQIAQANAKMREASVPFLELASQNPLLLTRANQELLNNVHNDIQAALGIFQSLSEADRKQSPGGRALFSNILMIMEFVEETDAMWLKNQQTTDADRRACEQLRDEKQAGLKHLIELGLKNHTSGFQLNEAGIAMWIERNTTDLAAADAFAETCKDAETFRIYAACYGDVHGENSIEHFFKDNDPEAWCHIAPKARQLLAAEVLETAQINGSAQAMATAAFMGADSDGWISSDSLLSHNEMFSMTPEKRATVIEPVKAIFDQLGMEEEDFKAAFAPMDEAYAKQGREVLARAPNLKRMRGSSTFYGADLAKTQVKRVFPSAKVVATSTYPDWSVTKNALGVPLYRDRNGWIVFQVEGEPFCQERTFVASEDYNGSGYTTDRSVSFGSVRWLPCDQ